jgi:hypothetical protein
MKNKNEIGSCQGKLFDDDFRGSHTLKSLGARILTIYGVGIKEVECEVFEVEGDRLMAVYDGMIYPLYYIYEIINDRKIYYKQQERRNGLEYRKWNLAYSKGIGKYSWKYMVEYNLSVLCAIRSEIDFVKKNKQNMLVRKIMNNQHINFFAVDYRSKLRLIQDEDIHWYNATAKYYGRPAIKNWNELVVEV